ncbi:MAG: peptide chain release factor 1 [Endomicrobium sp.]|jgi:peptide chain release factor 1|nr:peptide chain release factor 1 [Endomicrobium sp.]
MFIFFKKLQELNFEFETIKDKLNTLVYSEDLHYKELTKKYLYLNQFAEKYIQYCNLMRDKDNTDKLRISDEKDIRDLACIEYEDIIKKQVTLEHEISKLFNEKDTKEKKTIIVEIRAGTGGVEASLFVSDLYRMYVRFIDRNQWKYEVLTSSHNMFSGYKEIIFEASGNNIWNAFKFEKGVHRVQRIPSTETTGRVHTSTATVAVLQEVQENEIDLKLNELRIDTYRASGAGGQHVNKTDSAIRITHLPTGLVVTCQDERSQQKNKSKALKILLSKLYEKQNIDSEKQLSHARKEQIGSGNRSEKIRTYNFAQNRVTDHRLGFSIYGINDILNGNLFKLINKLNK